MNNIAILSPNWEPMVDGLSGHTSCFAIELSQNQFNVFIITSSKNRSSTNPSIKVFATIESWSFKALGTLKNHLVENKIETLFVQYTPFAYAKRGGINYFIPFFILYCKIFLKIRVHTLFHEINWPFELKPKSLLMFFSHKLQASLIATFSQQTFVSNIHFVKLIKAIAPWSKTSIVLNSGSNLPMNQPSQFRNQGDLKDKFLICLFGAFHPSKRQVLAIESIVTLPKELLSRVKIIFIGQNLKQIEDSIPNKLFNDIERYLVALGNLSDQDAANALSSCDAFICPYIDGANRRRGTLMAALKLGVPIISCKGKNYEPIFSDIPNLYSLNQDEKLFKSDFKELISKLINKREDHQKDLTMKIYNNEFSWSRIIERYLSSWHK